MGGEVRASGLTIVGVHTPEFGFEHDLDNVVTHSRASGVDYPVAVDSDYGVWRAFANHFWPALYLADAEGRIRYHHFGEGEYAMSEMAIQQLLMDAGAPVSIRPGHGRPAGLEVAADWANLQSPETYVGYGQATGFASTGRRVRRAARATSSSRCGSISGRSPARGPSPVMPGCSTSRAAGSHSAFTHATSTW